MGSVTRTFIHARDELIVSREGERKTVIGARASCT